MRKSGIAAGILLLIMVMAFQNCGRGYGTDTGNPMRSLPSTGAPITAGYRLAYASCQKIASCFVGSSASSCQVSAGRQAGLASKFTVSNAALTSLNLAQSLEASGALHPVTAALVACEAELAALSCSDPLVQGAYDTSLQDPYTGLPAMIPQNGSCPQVYP